eukprot:3983897-Amphidinium_carterae.3
MFPPTSRSVSQCRVTSSNPEGGECTTHGRGKTMKLVASSPMLLDVALLMRQDASYSMCWT